MSQNVNETFDISLTDRRRIYMLVKNTEKEAKETQESTKRRRWCSLEG